MMIIIIIITVLPVHVIYILQLIQRHFASLYVSRTPSITQYIISILSVISNLMVPFL